MHIERHQQMLKNAIRETLGAVITQMKQERPEAFQIETGANETLSQRRFAYEAGDATADGRFQRDT
ncbi:hypothetical protein [Caballeronia sp. LZ001]|uniref:hypothetical protein n=1 Tax=Caballeronia sp. LZ001 TaxID=3038553 RepID=UPI0028619132|nr:hypothetical protein [Caballeronia sp. LZ001]MDR5800664.1 hypothetical protein [Caballeronia sp. LZ001]